MDQSLYPVCIATIPPDMLEYETHLKPASSIIIAKSAYLGNILIDSTKY